MQEHKDIFAEECKRELEFRATASGEGDRTIELSFSSEESYERYDWIKGEKYMEVLDHSPENCDLSRLNNAHPLLLNHDTNNQIGVVEKAFIGPDRKGRAIVRFSKSQLGEEIWNDVKDGIRRLVSVGYRRVKEVARTVEKGSLDVVRFAWLPFEISIVPVPADASVGVGRSAEKKEAVKEKITMPDPVTAPDYKAEAKEILASAKLLRGKVPNIQDIADKAISEGQTVEQFRKAVQDALPELKPIDKPMLSDVPERDWKNYSITRAINAQVSGKGLSGFEREISDEIAKRTNHDAQGFWLPSEVFGRNFETGTVSIGGALVQTTNAGDQFIALLRNRARVAMLGARTITLNGPTTIPKQTTAGSANWAAETVASTLSTGTFGQLTLTPKTVTAFQQYSKVLLETSNPSIDMLVRDDIANILAIAIDKAALHGTGTAQPTGIAGTTGINTVAYSANGLAINNATLYPFLVSLEGEVAADNADIGNLAYLVRPGHRSAAKTTVKWASTASPVWEEGNMLNGYRAEVTNQIATNLTTGTATTICSAIFFGDWSQVLIAQFAGGATDIVVDPYVLAANRVVRILAHKMIDIGVRTPESFCVGGGLLTT